jgi:hypothetical protein
MARRHEKTMAGRIFENILFLEEVFGTRMMPISRMYRFSNWQNALNCLTQEPCAPPKHAGNLGRFGIAQVKCRITEVSDWGIMGPMDGYFEITVKVVGFMQVYC